MNTTPTNPDATTPDATTSARPPIVHPSGHYNMPAVHDQGAVHSAQVAYDNEKKNPTIAYLLWWFTGIFGGHRFYTGDIGMALGMLFTLGGLGIWAVIDVFLIGNRVKELNRAEWSRIAAHYGVRA
ncbi:TM2 domain-containing protein [Citricoccus alkalitolerans]|uniref:TM2 domain-containing protein n=1 Tax=Citricoccus alkalitolerans TaxID=246603 RepID=A0ABV8XWM2_9MICC